MLAPIFQAFAILALVCALAGCTTVEHLHVNTTAVNCDVSRGTNTAIEGQGEAGANLVSQALSGAGAGSLNRLLNSVIDCGAGGASVSTEVRQTGQRNE